MKVIINGIEITSEFKGNKIAPWCIMDSACQSNYNHHIITIQNIQTRTYRYFDYWQSINRVRIESQADLLLALNNILTDYSIPEYCEDFKDFCNQFGYSIEGNGKKSYAVKIWKDIKSNAVKTLSVFGNTRLIEKTVEDLQTIGAC